MDLLEVHSRQMAETDGTLLWTASHGLRCVVVPFFGHYQLRLLRDLQVVKTEVFGDETSARAAAKKWRRAYSAPRRRRSHARPAITTVTAGG